MAALDAVRVTVPALALAFLVGASSLRAGEPTSPGPDADPAVTAASDVAPVTAPSPQSAEPSAQAVGKGAAAAMPPEIAEIIRDRQAATRECGRDECPGGCLFHAKLASTCVFFPLKARLLDGEVGLFALGQPYQFQPYQYGWAVMTPPIPVKPKPGTPPKPPAPFKPLWQDQDWTYLSRPDNKTVDAFDVVKQINIGNGAIVSDISGEFRWQGRVEDNRRLTGEQNNFNLFRERLALNTWYFDTFRTYLDVFWADASHQTVPPVFFDRNHGDLLNAFGEVRFKDFLAGSLSARMGGREQMNYGNQRLVSALDWANSPRTFDTVAHLIYRSDAWSADGFWCRPNVIQEYQLDKPNGLLQFFGTYWTYKGFEGHVLDYYYLGLLDASGTVKGSPGHLGDAQTHTLGTRWQMDRNNWLAEIETAYQFGRHADLPINAGMATGGVGRRFADVLFTPEVWFFYDYASGNQNPKGNNYATFNQLFPLGHKYFGYMDIVGRQNILDPNLFMKFTVSKRVNFLLWFHDFHLASARDALYNGAGVPIRRDPTGAAGRYVGNELDLLINVILNPHADWQFGVCNFFPGRFVIDTAKDYAQTQSGSFFYAQFSYRF